DAAHRLDMVSRVRELLSQTLHVGIHGARGRVTAHAPDVVQEHRATLHSLTALAQRHEQLELEGCELDLAVAHPDSMSISIDAQVTELQRTIDGRGTGLAS